MSEKISTKDVLGILIGLFFLWFFFGGLLESKDSKREYKKAHTIEIDCSNPEAAKYNKFCNGDFEYDSQLPDIYESGAYRGW